MNFRYYNITDNFRSNTITNIFIYIIVNGKKYRRDRRYK